MVRRVGFGTCIALMVAGALACTQSAQNPASPSPVSPSGVGAAADGSTLKVSAPKLTSPIDNTRTDTRKPTFVFENAKGKFAGATFGYQLELYDPNNALIARVSVTQGAGTTTQYAYGTDLAKDTPHTWRVRATLDNLVGPWSATAGFITVKENRAPDPPPGQKLPLPNGLPIVQAASATFPPTDATACPDEYPATGWQWLDRVVAALRETDTRWGYNWKRKIVGSMSTDVINYHWGSGPDEGSTDVYTVKILRCQADGRPPIQWIDITDPSGPGAMWTCARCTTS